MKRASSQTPISAPTTYATMLATKIASMIMTALSNASPIFDANEAPKCDAISFSKYRTRSGPAAAIVSRTKMRMNSPKMTLEGRRHMVPAPHWTCLRQTEQHASNRLQKQQDRQHKPMRTATLHSGMPQQQQNLYVTSAHQRRPLSIPQMSVS